MGHAMPLRGSTQISEREREEHLRTKREREKRNPIRLNHRQTAVQDQMRTRNREIANVRIHNLQLI